MITILLAFALMTGCDPEGASTPTESPVDAVLPEGATVVAEVDGTPITKARVVRLAGETGLSPEEVVERLIDFELLAAEARRRGLARGREARMAVRKSMVQRFLEEEFEATHRPEDLSDEMLRKSYESNIRVFVRDRGVKVSHILVMAMEKDSTRSERAEAERIARLIYREARKAPDVETFRSIGESHKGRYDQEIRVEALSQRVALKANLDPLFIEAALALEKIGEISPPTQSSFGTHIIYLEDQQEAVNKSFEEAREIVREKEHPFWRKNAFMQLSEELRLSTKVTGWSGERRRGLDS